MNLIILSDLTCDEGLFFRYVSMMANTELGYSVVVEARQEDVDFYFKTLKQHGWFDYVDDFVIPEWNVDGVRIDKEANYPRTIVTPRITCENTPRILGQIKFMRDL